MQRLAVAVCEQTKDCLQLQATLLDDYADILKYRGEPHKAMPTAVGLIAARRSIVPLQDEERLGFRAHFIAT